MTTKIHESPVGVLRMRDVYTSGAMISLQAAGPMPVSITEMGFETSCIFRVGGGAEWQGLVPSGTVMMPMATRNVVLLESSADLYGFTDARTLKVLRDHAYACIVPAPRSRPVQAKSPAYHSRERLHELRARAHFESGEDVPTLEAVESADRILSIAERRIQSSGLPLCTVVGPGPEGATHLQWTDRRAGRWLHLEIVCPARPVENYTTLRTVETATGATVSQAESNGISFAEAVATLEKFLDDVSLRRGV